LNQPSLSEDAAKECFLFRLTVLEGKVYIAPLSPPDKQSKSFNEPTSGELWAVLLQALQAPEVGEPYRPQKLLVEARVHRGLYRGRPSDVRGCELGSRADILDEGHAGSQGCSVYFVVGDAEALYEFHRANGVEIVEGPRDQPYGLREYTARDLDGYYLNFGHRLRRAAAYG
jgi:hypothetical protein